MKPNSAPSRNAPPAPSRNPPGQHPSVPDGRAAYSIRGFCQAYTVGRSLAYREIAIGRLQAVKAGRRTIILKAEAEAWAASLQPSKSI